MFCCLKLCTLSLVYSWLKTFLTLDEITSNATRTSGMLFAWGKRAMFDKIDVSMLDITRHSPQIGSADASRIL